MPTLKSFASEEVPLMSKLKRNGYKYGSPNPFGHQSFGFLRCNRAVVAGVSFTTCAVFGASVMAPVWNAMSPSLPLKTPVCGASEIFVTVASIVTSAESVFGSGRVVVMKGFCSSTGPLAVRA